ncbi:MAG: FAD-binding oxidoreductase, partial [Albidovulum sp.]
MAHDAALAELHSFLGDRLIRSGADLAAHGQSEAWLPATPPDAVAYPETTGEVAHIVATCARHHCPVIAWGTGTSLEGHALAIQGGVS